MLNPKIFVGTLYCGEGDFEQSKALVDSQKNVSVHHCVISDLPEKEAHNTLWKNWREAKQTGEFDLFVKIDADTILVNDLILSEIYKIFENDKDVTGLQAPLSDFFTARLINGLNCFSPIVTFNDTTDSLFCDRSVDVNHKKVIKSNNVPIHLIPAGYHCFEANEEQSFHFGVHRALKKQMNVIKDVEYAWKTRGDKRRGLVILGAQYSQYFSKNDFNYNDKHFKDIFSFVTKNFDTLTKELLCVI